MRIARILVPAVLAAAGLIVPAVAGAAPVTAPVVAPHQLATPSPTYVPQPPQLTITPPIVIVGNAVIIHGTNFGPNDTITIALTIVIAAPHRIQPFVPAAYDLPALIIVKVVTADATGSFTTTLQM